MKDVVQFLQEVRIELSKVIWPKPEEFFGATLVVLVVVAASAIYLGIVDFALAQLMSYIFKLYGSI